MTEIPTAISPRPKLKGIVHALGACVFFPLILDMHEMAATAGLRQGVVIYGCGLIGLLSVSAVYHGLPWPPGLRRHLRRLDRAMIYVLIAGTMTPICCAFNGIIPNWFLQFIWICAAAGIILSIGWPEAPKRYLSLCYVVFGLISLGLVPTLILACGPLPVILLVLGGFVYIIGAIIYVREKPNLFVGTFEYHELFHTLVVFAAYLHFKAIEQVCFVVGPQ
ncbi:MAG: hemolysin III family protein [Myxococcota bacterium]|nr:hemolysin III family protein [Myxococcota bacterium]